MAMTTAELGGGIPTLPPPVGAGGRTAYFKLKTALDYRFWNKGRLIFVQKDQVYASSNPEDIAMLRNRNDVLGECDAKGVMLGSVPSGQVDPNKAKSFRNYRGREPNPRSSPSVPAPPPTVPVGRVPAMQAPALPATEMTAVAGGPVPPPPPPPERKSRKERRAENQQALATLEKGPVSGEPMSPIEEVSADGKTIKTTQVR